MVIRRRETHGQEEEGWEYVLSLCLSACAWSGTGNEGQSDRDGDKEWWNNVSLLTCRAATHQRVCLCYYKNPLIPNASLWN